MDVVTAQATLRCPLKPLQPEQALCADSLAWYLAAMEPYSWNPDDDQQALEAARNGGIALNAVVDDHRRIANMLRNAQDAGLVICEGKVAISLLAGCALEEQNNAFASVRPGFWLRLDQVIESESLSTPSPQLGLAVLESRLRGGGIERDWAAISNALASPHPWFAARWEVLPLPHHGYEFRRRQGTP